MSVGDIDLTAPTDRLEETWDTARVGGGAPTVLGLFPAFEVGNPGGIQVSGRSAWKALHGTLGGRARAVQVDLTETPPSGVLDDHTTLVGTRRGALWQVWRQRGRAETVLCWHLDLLPLAKLARGKRVLFLHGIEAWRTSSWLQRGLQPRLQLLLANSEFTLNRALEAAPRWARLPSTIVPLGVNAPCPPGRPPDDPPTAIMIGRLDRNERYKGHDAVIASWPRIRERLPQARLLIVGDGDLRPELERRCRTQALDDGVRFLGRVAESDKEALLARARCLVMPSRAEGFGLVYAEAMRLGRPCLVSTSDAGREVVNPPECGLAADPNDAAALSSAIVALLTPGSGWEAMSAQARRRYAERYTEEAFQERLLAALGIDQTRS
jgi:glycosyltransferase involved in cell wall biosynthesis